MTWIDSHCHLDSLDDPAGAVGRALVAGVTAIVSAGTDIESSHRSVGFASTMTGVYATAGVHPHEAATFDLGRLTEIEELASAERVVAIGEIGLDYFRGDEYRKEQRELMAAQLQISARLGKPVVLHVRDAFEDIFAMLEALDGQVPMFHCFSGTPAHAERALELGGYVSFAGNVSYKSAEGLRDAARMIPQDRILVETDSPYLAPVPFRGRTNEPANLAHVGRALADALDLAEAELASITATNASNLFVLGRI